MNVIPKFMRFYDTETLESNEDKENFNPVVKQYSPVKNIIKKRNTVLKELTERNRHKGNLEVKSKKDESEIGFLFNNMDLINRKSRFGREI